MCSNLKVVLVIFLSVIFTKSINAQISIGVQGGFNSAILELSNKAPEAKLSYNNGYVLGAIINYEITKVFSLQVEPRFIQKGERAKLDVGYLKVDNKLFYNYLELPIYFVAEFTELQLRPFILGGINIAYLLKVKAETNNNGKEETFDITEDFKKHDLAVDLGMGIKYKATSSSSFLFSIRYSYGVYDISKNEGTIKTRGFQILLGYLYNL